MVAELSRYCCVSVVAGVINIESGDTIATMVVNGEPGEATAREVALAHYHDQMHEYFGDFMQRRFGCVQNLVRGYVQQ